APWGDDSWQIWACGPDNAGGLLPRISKWFEIHGDLCMPDAQAWEKSYVDWLNRQPFELLVQDRALFPRGTLFPADLLKARFGTLFFTSTPAWMMALAIQLGAVEIGLYGLDMASRHEYLTQRP